MGDVPPLVSIVLPAFNAEPTLAACLRSVQRQTESRWHCIVVDDGSTDGTAACAQAFAARDRRFRCLSRPHGGLVAALQAGVEAATADFVARMDADDLMHRDRLAAQLRAFEAEPSLAVVGTHVRCFPRRDLREGRRDYERWLNSVASPESVLAELFVECPLAHPTLMIRRRVLSEVGYRDTEWAEDYDLILRLAARGYRMAVIPRRLVSWRDGPARLSRTSPRYGIDRFIACKAAFLADGFLAGSGTYVLWGYGATGRALRRALLAHDKRPSHIVEIHPGRLGKTIHGAPVIRPGGLLDRPRAPVVVSVAGAAPRRRIRTAMSDMGFRERADFVCAA